ncbi:MAG TPA: FMN-binding negative transcriptional regulator, partial [Xanthomonadales bacterium]|nr:FMN-binding negative transcriptional regulator [Xanthomonadales bacterium]
DCDADGRLVRLVGHMARSNPQFEEVRKAPRCCFLFQGPHGYISPRFVPDRNWGPTWNYALVRVYTELEFRPDMNDVALARLVEKLETGQANAWAIDELGERYTQLRQHIIAFEARVLSVDARFKLGQDERPEVLASILEKADNPQLVAWMRRMNRHRLEA